MRWKKYLNNLKEETVAKETFASWKNQEIWEINFVNGVSSVILRK